MNETVPPSGCWVTIYLAWILDGIAVIEREVERLRRIFHLLFLPLRRLHKQEKRISIHAKLLVYHTHIASP